MKINRIENKMTLILTIIVLFTGLCYSTHAQSYSNPFNIVWQKTYGGSQLDDNDYLNNTIAVTLDGGYIFTGETFSNDMDVSGNHGMSDAWVCKIDGAGTIQWQKCIGGSSWDQGQNIIATSDGGYLVGIYTESSDGDIIGYHGKGDVILVKLNASGNIQWKKILGSSKYDDCADIMQNSDGTFIFAGVTEGNDGDVSGNHGKTDSWVVKLDANGNILWQKCYGGKNADGDYHGTEIIPGIGGGYLLATLTNSTDGSITGLHGKPGKKWYSSTTDLGDAWLLKLDDNSNIEWQKSFGGPLWDMFENIIVTNDGNYLSSGLTQGAGGDIPGNNGANGISDWWLAKISPTGNLIWSRNYGGTGAEALHGRVFELPNGDLILPSGTRSNDHDCIGLIGPPDLWTVKTDPLGNILSYNVWGGTGYENMSYAVMNTDGSMVIAAMKDSTSNDFAHDQNSDFWILKIAPNLNDNIAITTTSLSQSVACPGYSPFAMNVAFTKRGTFNAGNIFTAELSDANGSFASPLTVGTINGTNSGTISCNIPAGLPSGNYYSVRIRSSSPQYIGITSGHLLNIQSCAAPTELTSTNISNSGAQLNWNIVPCAIQYKVQYSKSPNASWSNANTVYTTGTSIDLTGLNSSSTYFWRVQTKCASSPNVWSDVSVGKQFITISTITSTKTQSVPLNETSFKNRLTVFPNPASQATTIYFSLSQSEKVSIKIFDIKGELVKTIAERVFGNGEQQIKWNSADVKAGVYLLKMESVNHSEAKKLVVIK